MADACEVLILGAGIIGLSLALELQARGLRVTVRDRGLPLRQASTAAAGMLAARDPHNPPQLLALAVRSQALYPSFLARIETLSGVAVPFQTETTVQVMPDGQIARLAERSIDPRQLAPALLRATEAAGVRIEAASVENSASLPPESRFGRVVHTTGAWTQLGLPVSPRKGQMLRFRWPAGQALDTVYRDEEVYVVPRTRGPQAGTALVGATVEDAGFDWCTHPGALHALRQRAVRFLPEIADERLTPTVEAWAGLRPATPDGLPVLGRWAAHRGPSQAQFYVATGHFRNGILLAPATAETVAELMLSGSSEIDLGAFSPARFATGPSSELPHFGHSAR